MWDSRTRTKDIDKHWYLLSSKISTEIQNLVDKVIELNESVGKAHDKIASVGKAGAGIQIPLAPSGVGIPAKAVADFGTAAGEASLNSDECGIIKTDIEQIQSKINNMKQK